MKNFRKIFMSLLVCGVASLSVQSAKAYEWTGSATMGSLVNGKKNVTGVRLNINYGETDEYGNLISIIPMNLSSSEDSQGNILTGCTANHYSMSLNNADSNSIVKSLNTSNGTTNGRERLNVNVLKTGTQTINIVTTNSGDDWPAGINQYDNTVVVTGTYSTNFVAAATALGITFNENNTMYYADNINVYPTDIDHFEAIINALDEYNALNAYEKQLLDSIIATSSDYANYSALYTAADNYLTTLANLFILNSSVNGLKGEVVAVKENAQTIIDAETEYNGLKDIVKNRVNDRLENVYESVDYPTLLIKAKALKFIDTYSLDTKLANLTKNIDTVILSSQDEWNELDEDVQNAVESYLYYDESIAEKYSYETWIDTVQDNYDQRIAEEFVNKYDLENYDTTIFEDFDDDSYVETANYVIGLNPEYSEYTEEIQNKIDALVGTDWVNVISKAQNYLDELEAKKFVADNKLSDEYTEEIASNIVNLEDEFAELSESVQAKVLANIEKESFEEKVSEAQDYLDELAANKFIATNELLEEMTDEIATNTLLLDDDFKALTEGAQAKVLDLLASGDFDEVKEKAQAFLDTEAAKNFITENISEELSEATEANFNKIIATKDAYDKLNDAAKNIVNSLMTETYEISYDELLEDALEIQKNTSYEMLEYDKKYDIASGKEFVFRSSGTFGLFSKLYVDDELVDPSNYTVVEGSTVVTLKPEYLKTLSTGDHTLKMVYVNDLSVSADFTVVNTASGNPKTSDDIMLYSFILITGIIGLAGGLYIKKRNA